MAVNKVNSASAKASKTTKSANNPPRATPRPAAATKVARQISTAATPASKARPLRAAVVNSQMPALLAIEGPQAAKAAKIRQVAQQDQVAASGASKEGRVANGITRTNTIRQTKASSTPNAATTLKKQNLSSIQRQIAELQKQADDLGASQADASDDEAVNDQDDSRGKDDDDASLHGDDPTYIEEETKDEADDVDRIYAEVDKYPPIAPQPTKYDEDIALDEQLVESGVQSGILPANQDANLVNQGVTAWHGHNNMMNKAEKRKQTANASKLVKRNKAIHVKTEDSSEISSPSDVFGTRGRMKNESWGELGPSKVSASINVVRHALVNDPFASVDELAPLAKQMFALEVDDEADANITSQQAKHIAEGLGQYRAALASKARHFVLPYYHIRTAQHASDALRDLRFLKNAQDVELMHPAIIRVLEVMHDNGNYRELIATLPRSLVAFAATLVMHVLKDRARGDATKSLSFSKQNCYAIYRKFMSSIVPVNEEYDELCSMIRLATGIQEDGGNDIDSGNDKLAAEDADYFGSR